MFKSAGILICALIFLSGCSGASVKAQKPADVTSTPSGATVYANGKELGKTPLRHDLYDAFPAGWADWKYQAQGVLTVKMDGCEDYTLTVSDYALSKPIHAELKCSGPVQSDQAAPIKTPDSGAEKRLEELEALYKKGVITKDEYNSTRARILNEL
jgi:hypothetical protein